MEKEERFMLVLFWRMLVHGGLALSYNEAAIHWDGNVLQNKLLFLVGEVKEGSKRPVFEDMLPWT